MRLFRPTRSILADIQNVLAENRPSFHHSPLEEVAGLLTDGRHYGWVGIYLTLDKKSSSPLLETTHPAHVTLPGTLKKVMVSIRIAGRELGFLSVESDRENSFGADDRVLLEQVATVLGRFLTGPGKYLVRRATELSRMPAPRAAAA